MRGWIYFLVFTLGLGAAFAEIEEITWQSGLESTLKNNPGILQAQTRVHEADAKKTQFWSVILPHISGSTRTLPTTINLAIKEQVYGQGIPAQYRMARIGEQAALANLELAAVEAVYAFREAYCRLLLAQRTAELREEFAKHLEKSVQVAPAMFEAAKIRKMDVSRLQVRAGLARNASEEAKLAVQAELLKMERIMGVNHLEGRRLVGEFRDEIPQGLSVEKLTATAYEQRRDLWLAENLKIAATEKIRVVAAAAFPEMFLFANSKSDPGRLGFRTGYSFDFKRRQEDPGEKPADFTTTLKVGNEIRWQIFDGGLTRGGVAVAKEDLVAQEELVRRIKRDIPAQVKGAIELIDQSRRQIELTREGDPDEALRLAQSDFDSGKATQLDLLDTQSLVLRQKEFRQLALANMELSLAALDRATGLGIRLVKGSETKKKD